MSLRGALGGAAAGLLLAAMPVPAAAQDEPLPPPQADERVPEYDPPLDLTRVPAMPRYKPKKTPWGDPDLRGVWPVDSLGGLPLQRSEEQGNRVFLTREEYRTTAARMLASQQAYAREAKEDRIGMGHWVEMTGAGHRTSLLIDPPNGRLPPLTEEGKRRAALMRSSWVPGQTFEAPEDFDNWDRCVTRGFPASMLPFRYNNGVRVFQAPGYVVISLEMLGTRIIPIAGERWPEAVEGWLGHSVGRWEGNMLVVETTNIKPGASAINMGTMGAPPNNTLPMSAEARVTERFALAGRDTLVYEMTLTDPVVWQAPFTVRMDIPRNDEYRFFEYACHEGNVQIRNYISADRARRAQEVAEANAAPALAGGGR